MPTAAPDTLPSTPLTSPDRCPDVTTLAPLPLTLTRSTLKVRLELWAYRIATYLLVNVMDDPAWLALMFC